MLGRISTLVLFLCMPLLVYSAEASTPLLPDQFANWRAESPAKPTANQDFASNFDAILRESGQKQAEQREYKNGTEQITVRAFRLHDPSSAYELYTSLLSPGMKKIDLGDHSVSNGAKTVSLIGDLVVQADLPATVKPEVLKGLLDLLKSKADHTPLPPVKDYLPSKGRIFGSEKYALAPQAFTSALNGLEQSAYADLVKEVGFENGVEAMFGRFHSQKKDAVLLLLEYPTPQLAEQHLHHVQTVISRDALKAGASVERKASLLSLVFVQDSPEFIQALRNDINYETSVTWNEPSQTATDPPWFLVMSKIFIFTGIFMGVATALGIAFGGVRVITKRLFPGKVFDRPEDIEVIQLGLSGKKIDASDMY
jgi:hypothetical protein